MSKTHDRRQKQIRYLPPNTFLPLQEIARQVDIDASTLARWAREERVPAQRNGKIWYLNIQAIEQRTGQRLSTANLRPIHETSALTGIPANTLRRWARDGRIQAEKHGGKWRVSVEDARRLSQTLVPGVPARLDKTR